MKENLVSVLEFCGYGNCFGFLMKYNNVLHVKRMLFIHDMVLRKHWMDKLLLLE